MEARNKGERRLVVVSMPLDLMEKLEEIKRRYRVSYSTLIRMIVAEKLNGKTPEEIINELPTLCQGVSEPE